MTYYRRVLTIVRRSFYRHSHQHIKHTNRYIHSSTKHHSHHHKTLHPSSTRLLTYHYHKYSTLKPSIAIEPKNVTNTSFKKRLIFIAAATTLSYIGYKYYMYDSDTNNPNKSALKTLMTDIIETTVINANLAFKIGLFWDNRNRHNKALYFYKLYLRRPNNKQGEYAALNNLSIIYYKLNEYNNALIAFELLGNKQIIERNLEFLRAHCYHSNKDYPSALKWYLKFLSNKKSKTSDIYAAYNNLALLYYEIGKYEKSLEYFNKLGETVISEKNYAFRVAHSLQKTKDFDKAIEYYNQYLSNANTTKENKENTYHNLGVLFYETDRDREALDMFGKLGETEIRKRNLEFKMAHLCAKVDDKRSAIKYLKNCKNRPEIYGKYAIICQGIMAQIMYEIGEYDNAMCEFEDLGQKEIIAQDLCFPAAFTYFQCKEYEKALMNYELLLSAKGDTLDRDESVYIHSRIALIHYKQRNYTKAVSVISNEMSDEYISKYNMEFVCAHSYHKLGTFDKAQFYYDMFLNNGKSDAKDIINCYQNLALLYYDLNKYQKCVEFFDKMEESMIINRDLEFYLGHSLQECDQSLQSIKYYTLFLDKIKSKTNVSENDRLNALNVYQNLGNVYYTLSEWQNACDIWTNLDDSDITQRNLALKLSKCYAMIGDNESENKYLSLANHVHSQSMEQIQLAKMYYNMYQNEMAIAMFERVSDEDIIANKAVFIVAHAYQLMGNNGKAIEYYKMGLECPDGDMSESERNNAWHNLGCAYHDNGEYESAINCFDRLSGEHIRQTNIEFIIGVSYHNSGDYENALKYYKQFLENGLIESEDINVVNCWNNMAVLYYYHLKDYKSAWIVLERMGKENVRQKKLEFEIAHCAQKMKKNKVSLMYYYAFLSNTPKSELSDEIINTIYDSVVSICEESDSDLDRNAFAEFKKMKNMGNGGSGNNKEKELKLFLEWINKD